VILPMNSDTRLEAMKAVRDLYFDDRKLRR